jgi:hypothetical protein
LNTYKKFSIQISLIFENFKKMSENTQNDYPRTRQREKRKIPLSMYLDDTPFESNLNEKKIV